MNLKCTQESLGFFVKEVRDLQGDDMKKLIAFEKKNLTFAETDEEVRMECFADSTYTIGVYWKYGNKDEMAGYAILGRRTDHFEIIRFGIFEKFQFKGYGSFLLDYVIDVLGKTPIWLEVSVLNKAAIKLYLKKGFQISRIRKNYYAKNVDCFEMTYRTYKAKTTRSRINSQGYFNHYFETNHRKIKK